MVEGKAASTDKRILDKESEFKGGKLESPSPLAQPPKCPECNSKRVWRDGLRYTKQGEVQRYLCRSCGHRFSDSKVKVNVIEESLVLSDPMHNLRDLDSVHVKSGKVGFKDSALAFGKDVGSHGFPMVGKTINDFLPNSRECQVCVSEREAKNLSQQSRTRQKRAAGATKPDLATIKGMLVKHAWWMEKEGRKESTIKLRSRLLRTLMRRGANLLDPESVKETIARFQCQDGTKLQYVNAYKSFAVVNGISWKPPKYEQLEKLPFIPTEAELDQLIAACGKKTAALLQLLKETAMRVGEALRINWTDIDVERSIITFNHPEKRGKARIFKVSSKLVGMLQRLPKESEKIFKATLTAKQRTFVATRKKVARALQNPRILKVKFHTFRHWKATTEYRKTKDVLHVMKLLGHRNIKNTLIYIDLENALFSGQNDEFHVKVADTAEEACKLAEVGFEYFTTIDGVQIFRKRK